MEYTCMDDFLIYSTEVHDKLLGTPVVIDTMSGIWLCGTICWRLDLMKARAISEMTIGTIVTFCAYVLLPKKTKTKKQNKKTNKNKNKNFLKYGDLSIISGYLRYSALVLQLHRSNPWKLLALFFKRILLDHLWKGNKVCCLLYWSQMQNNLRLLKVYYSHLKSKQGLQGSAMNLWP